MSKKNIFNRLMDAIGNVYGVCGLMANIEAESNFKSTNMQNSYEARLGMNDASYTQAVDNGSYTKFATDGVGYGLCQWTSSGRKASLISFARNQGESIGDENMQIDFLLYELSTSYKKVLEVLKNATSVKEASDYVCTKFERPKDQSASALASRANKGMAIFTEFAGKTEGVVEMTTINAYSLKKDGTKKLSANFKVKEFACKDGSDPIFIAPELVEILQKIRSHFGKAVNINSAYRTATYNKKVGGATYSQHLYGMAADIRVTGIKPKAVAQYAETLMPNSGGIGIYSNFTHIDIRETKSRWNG